MEYCRWSWPDRHSVEFNKASKESTWFIEYPWKVVGSDLFDLQRRQYLLVVDYFSQYSAVTLTTASLLIVILKHKTRNPQNCYIEGHNSLAGSLQSSLHPMSSNIGPVVHIGMVERAVKTKEAVEAILQPLPSCTQFRATQLAWCGLSPSEFLMGRQIWMTVPQISAHFVPKWIYLAEFCQADKWFKEKNLIGGIGRIVINCEWLHLTSPPGVEIREVRGEGSATTTGLVQAVCHC